MLSLYLAMKTTGTAANRFYNSELFDKNVLSIIKSTAFHPVPQDFGIEPYEVDFRKCREAPSTVGYIERMFRVTVRYVDKLEVIEISPSSELFKKIHYAYYTYSFIDGKEEGDFNVLLRSCILRDVHDDYNTETDPNYLDHRAICWHVVRKYYLEYMRYQVKKVIFLYYKSYTQPSTYLTSIPTVSVMTSATVSPVPMDIAIRDFIRKIFPKAYVYHQVTRQYLPDHLPYAICYQATDRYDRVQLIDCSLHVTFSYDFKTAECKGNAEVLWVTCDNLDNDQILKSTDTIVTVEPDDELQYYIEQQDVCGACRWLVKKYSQTSEW